MATKVTFSVDHATLEALNRVAARKQMRKSAVVRAAIQAYDRASDRVSEGDIARRLAILDAIAARAPTRPQGEVAAELAEIRAARRGGGRQHPVE